MSDYKLKNICDFDLAQTLECGQCFHFVKLDENDYVLTAKGRLLHVSQQADTVTFYDTEEDEYVKVWKDYFDMDRDYSEIKNKLLEKDDKLKDAIESMWGVRILNQDFFETLISFIISQNKQIPHIKQIVARISHDYGKYQGSVGGIDFYGFQIIFDCEFPVSLFPRDQSFQVVCLVVFRVGREPFVDVCKSFFQVVFCDEPVYFF